MLEVVIVWVVLAIGWALIKGVFGAMFGGGGSSSNLEEVVKSNPFSIKITKGIPKDTDLKINCFNIEMCGMVNHPTQDEIKVFLTVQDITDEEPGLPVLSAQAVFCEPNSRVLGFHQIVKTSYDGYYPDWVKFCSLPLDFIIPPHKGSRKLKFILLACDYDTELERGAVSDTSKVKHFASKEVNFSFKEPGYMDEVKNKDKVEELSIKLGMCMAAADGHLDQKELNVVKDWARNVTNLLDDDIKKERNKFFSKLIKESYIAAKKRDISLSKLVDEFNNIASKSQKYTAMQLMLDIASADGRLSKTEDQLINKIAKTTGVNLNTFKEMKDKVIANVDELEISEKPSEDSFGLTDDMEDTEKCKLLRKQYTKWNAQTNHREVKKKKRAKQMVKIIADMRKQYNC